MKLKHIRELKPTQKKKTSTEQIKTVTSKTTKVVSLVTLVTGIQNKIKKDLNRVISSNTQR